MTTEERLARNRIYTARWRAKPESQEKIREYMTAYRKRADYIVRNAAYQKMYRLRQKMDFSTCAV